ncbi:MAG: DAK2 domain-containing protein [Blautia sp.]
MVNKNTIDASMLAKMFLAGAKNLEAKKEWINELNVFPVPDGDTGTNMTLTIMAAVAEVSQIQDLTMEKLSKAISSGSLQGARETPESSSPSFCAGLPEASLKHTALDTIAIAAAMEKAVETAYKAVMKPKRTILTVARRRL